MIQFEILILDQLGIVPSKPEYLSPLTVLHTSRLLSIYIFTNSQVVYFTHIEDNVENSLKSIQ